MDPASLKACIMSRKGGVPLVELNREYKKLVGNDIDFSKTQFKTLHDFISSLPGVTVKGSIVTCACAETQHIQNMINKQKSSTQKHGQNGRPAPIRQYAIPKAATKRKSNIVQDPVAKKPLISRSPKTLKHAGKRSSLLEYLLQNLSYYDYNYVFNERHQLFNLVFSMCKLINDKQLSLAQLDHINGDSFWIAALKQQANKRPAENFIPIRKNLVIFGHQVVGDENILFLAQEKFSIRQKEFSACMSGLDLQGAQYHLVKQPCSSKIIISCGMIDISNGKPVDLIISEMQELILCALLRGAQPVVCNLPPSPFLWLNHSIAIFNCWLSTLATVQVVDLFSLFFYKDSTMTINLHMFQRDPVSFNGNPLTYAWSREAIQVVSQAIQRCCSNNLKKI